MKLSCFVIVSKCTRLFAFPPQVFFIWVVTVEPARRNVFLKCVLRAPIANDQLMIRSNPSASRQMKVRREVIIIKRRRSLKDWCRSRIFEAPAIACGNISQAPFLHSSQEHFHPWSATSHRFFQESRCHRGERQDTRFSRIDSVLAKSFVRYSWFPQIA